MRQSGLFPEGMRVIEFCQVAAGPFCGMLPADLGADVIRIENPTLPITRPPPDLGRHTEEALPELRRTSSITVEGA